MNTKKIYTNNSYGLLLKNIESEKDSKVNKTVFSVTSEIADIMKDYYTIDEKKIASYDYLIQTYNFTTKQEKIQALKLVAEHGITIDCLKAISNTHYGNNYKILVDTCHGNPGILSINSGILGFIIDICIQDNIDIKSIKRENIYQSSLENTLTKEKIELLYQIYGIKGLIYGINKGSLYHIQFMTVNEIGNIVNDNPDISIAELNIIAEKENYKKLQKLYEKNPPRSAWG